MLNRIQTREIIAWITLAIAFILFGATIAFGQTKTVNVENENGKVHIKISKTESGNTVKIDTTFDVTDNVNIDKIVHELSGDNDENISISSYSDSDDNDHKKKKQIIIDLDFPEDSKVEMEKLHSDLSKSMKEMSSGLEEMSKSLKSMHFHMDGDTDSENDFKFNFDMPDLHFENLNDICKNSFSYSYSHSDNEELDSLKDDKHIIIIAGKDEKAPELEKVITSKSGKQIFIYKRSGAKDGSGKKEKEMKSNEKPDIHNLEYYPNPTSGKFTVKFNTDEKRDILVQVLDNNGKELFSAKLNDFEGEYSKEIDLSDWSKGNYVLKISQGNKSVSKKVIVN